MAFPTPADEGFGTYRAGEAFYGYPGSFPPQAYLRGPTQTAPAASHSSLNSVVDYGDEPPLLEELGVNFGAIGAKTGAVLMLHKPVDAIVLRDADLAGPLVFCVVLGLCLLLVSLNPLIDVLTEAPIS